MSFIITFKLEKKFSIFLITLFHLVCVSNAIHDAIIYLQTGENNSPGLEVKTTYLDNHDFRIEVDGVIMDVSLAVYSKVNSFCLNTSLEVYLGEFRSY